MIKIDKTVSELKGMKLALVDGKNIINIGTFDAVAQVDDKGVTNPNSLTLHFVQGNKWTGEIIADLKDGMGLYFKGSIYSRLSAMARASQKVGSTL